jgi:hypothetical protein
MSATFASTRPKAYRLVGGSKQRAVEKESFMTSQVPVALRVLGAIPLAGLALFCGYGFLAAGELGFPNVWHFLYGAAGLAALAGAVWLVLPAFQWMMTGSADLHWASYWHPYRLLALFSLFSVLALTTGDFFNLGFLVLLLFLLPIPAKPRTQP